MILAAFARCAYEASNNRSTGPVNADHQARAVATAPDPKVAADIVWEDWLVDPPTRPATPTGVGPLLAAPTASAATPPSATLPVDIAPPAPPKKKPTATGKSARDKGPFSRCQKEIGAPPELLLQVQLAHEQLVASPSTQASTAVRLEAVLASWSGVPDVEIAKDLGVRGALLRRTKIFLLEQGVDVYLKAPRRRPRQVRGRRQRAACVG